MNEKQYNHYLRLLKEEIKTIVCIRNETYAEKWSRCDTIEDYETITLNMWKVAYECGDINLVIQLINEVYSEIYQQMIERENGEIIKFADAVLEEAFAIKEDE